MRFRDKQSPSRLERRFELLWKAVGGPPLEREYRFDPKRRWRSDFAHLPSRTLIEIEGGIWIQGRHNRAAGFLADLEKYFHAWLSGWSVVRLAGDHITAENLEAMVAKLREASPREGSPSATSLDA